MSKDRLIPQYAPLSNTNFVFIEDSDTIRALDVQSGITVWEIPFADMSGTPVIQGDILIVGSDGIVAGVDIKGREVIWRNNKNCWSDLLLASGLIYFNDYEHLISININSGQLLSSKWIEYGIAFAPNAWNDCIISYEDRWGGLVGCDDCSYRLNPYDYYFTIICPLVIHDNVIYAGGNSNLLYLVPYTGEIIRRFSNNNTGLKYIEILAIQNTSTGIVSYPTQSAMD